MQLRPRSDPRVQAVHFHDSGRGGGSTTGDETGRDRDNQAYKLVIKNNTFLTGCVTRALCRCRFRNLKLG